MTLQSGSLSKGVYDIKNQTTRNPASMMKTPCSVQYTTRCTATYRQLLEDVSVLRV